MSSITKILQLTTKKKKKTSHTLLRVYIVRVFIYIIRCLRKRVCSGAQKQKKKLLCKEKKYLKKIVCFNLRVFFLFEVFLLFAIIMKYKNWTQQQINFFDIFYEKSIFMAFFSYVMFALYIWMIRDDCRVEDYISDYLRLGPCL